MPADPDVHRVAVIGTGVIGASWAALFLAHGMAVAASDPSPRAEDRLRNDVARHAPTLAKLGLKPDAAGDRLRFYDDARDAVAGADFVQESGPENSALKVALIRSIEPALEQHAIIASSSSGLLVSALQREVGRPDRLIIGHPFNPPHLIPLVEIVGGDGASEDTIARAIAFYRAVGKQPIRLRREVPGHVSNRLQAALWREAFHIVAEGIATVAEVDLAISHGPGLRWAVLGPLLNLHLSGGDGGIRHVLAHLGPPIDQWWADLGAPSMTPTLQQVIEDAVEAAAAELIGDGTEAARDRIIVQLLRAKALEPALRGFVHELDPPTQQSGTA